MSKHRVSSRPIFRVAVQTLALFLGACPALGQSRSPNYTLLVASGFLCDASSCPAIARSDDGDAYEITGAGTLNTQSKSVTVAGTFAHKSSNGTVLESGVWIASDLISFDSYGIAPDALRQQLAALPPRQVGPKHLPLSARLVPTGGLAVFHIRLLSISGGSKTAVLQVNCALGDVPHERSAEGIRLALEGNQGEFSQETAGRAIFFALRPEVATPVKAQEQATAPPTSARPQN